MFKEIALKLTIKIIMRLMTMLKNAKPKIFYMTPTRRRARMPKYIIQVNYIGTKIGTLFKPIYIMYKKQLLKASKWRRDSPHYFIFQ